MDDLYGTTEIGVEKVLNTHLENEIYFVIEYVGVIQTALTINVDTSYMTGGSANDSVTATVETVREYSNNPFYSPVPYDFLRVASDKPSLTLSYKDLPSVCLDCSFEYDADKTFVTNSATLSGLDLTVSLTPSAARRLLQSSATLNDVSVTLADVECDNKAGTIDSFTCSFPEDSLVAGTHSLVI